jgi:hypothetical protein
MVHRSTAVAPGSSGADIVGGRKCRSSAFLPGASDPPFRLRAGGFDTVLIAGTATMVATDAVV